MKEKIVISGFGGQGIMFTGRIISVAGMEQEYHVAYMPSYGAEVRGGTANCNIIIKDSPIASPIIDTADCAFIMNLPSLLKFEGRIAPGGLLIINSSMVNKKPERTDIHIEYVPATETAYKLGNEKAANMVMLGRYTACRDILSVKSIIKNIRGASAEINKQALFAGRER